MGTHWGFFSLDPRLGTILRTGPWDAGTLRRRSTLKWWSYYGAAAYRRWKATTTQQSDLTEEEEKWLDQCDGRGLRTSRQRSPLALSAQSTLWSTSKRR